MYETRRNLADLPHKTETRMKTEASGCLTGVVDNSPKGNLGGKWVLGVGESLTAEPSRRRLAGKRRVRLRWNSTHQGSRLPGFPVKGPAQARGCANGKRQRPPSGVSACFQADPAYSVRAAHAQPTAHKPTTILPITKDGSTRIHVHTRSRCGHSAPQ